MTPHTIPKLSQYNLSLELGDSNIKDIQYVIPDMLAIISDVYIQSKPRW